MRRLAFVASLLAGCTGGLPVPQLVVTPRVLAITADRPESAPGTDVNLHVVAYDPMERPLTYAWRACLSLGELLRSARIRTGLPDEACFPLPSSTADALVPGLASQMIVEQLDTAAEAGGFDPSFLYTLLDTVGFAFDVEVDVIDASSGAVLVSAFKRIAITRRTPPTTNPPVIEYLVGETFVSMPTEGWTGTGDDCVIWGDPIVVEPEEELVLAPQGDPAEWIETFPLIGYDGTFTEGRENAYYSFYTTAGALSHETRRPPDRDATFTAPEEPGPVRLWLVVRDGHLGARACTFTLTVAAP
jgi:hypothetical protein